MRSSTDIVRSVKMFSDIWPLARAAWRVADPRLYAVTPEEPVDRLIESMPTAFGALVRAILHQQVSTASGRAIVRRFVEACSGAAEPDRVLRLTDEDLLRAGLSRGKTRYVRALAEAAAAGALEAIEIEPEEEIVRRLVALPGIGVWTVRMFLIFHLARPDVFSGQDLGLREGVQVLDALANPPSPEEAEARADAWRPFRSVAAVNLWDLVRRTREGRRAKAGSRANGPPGSRGGLARPRSRP
jgi:DNA-3-methyladenine glycosylase II